MRLPKYKLSVYSANSWLRIKELLAITPRKCVFSWNIHFGIKHTSVPELYQYERWSCAIAKLLLYYIIRLHYVMWSILYA